MDTKFCVATGVSADWGTICKWFLRRFDVACHDIAASRCEIDCMVETLDAAFLEGRVFQQVLRPGTPAAPAACTAAEEPLPRHLLAAPGAPLQAGFITQAVIRHLTN